MCVIPQLVSAPLNPIPTAEHFRRSHPLLDMNLIQILDSDHVSVVKKDSDPLFDEYADMFVGLRKLAGRGIR